MPDWTDAEFLSTIVKEFGHPLIVIDEGSHVWPHQIATLQHLFPRLSPDGVFIVEDLYTSFDKLEPIRYSLGSSISGYQYLEALTRCVTGLGWMVSPLTASLRQVLLL
jgi:hypothetical protein